jgi:hypothetical protein
MICAYRSRFCRNNRLNAKKSSLIANKVGDDLEVALEEGVIIFDNYFAVGATDLSCLVCLPTEDGGLYHIVADASFALIRLDFLALKSLAFT